MISLIYKDFLLLKKYILVGAILIMFDIYMCTTTNNNYFQAGIIIISSFILSYIIISSAITKDEKNKSEFILNSLPINREHIIIAKYLNVLFISALIWCAQFFTGIFFSILDLGTYVCYVQIIHLYINIIFITLYFSLYYPMYFKLGSFKLRTFNTIMYLFILLLPTLISKFHNTYIVKSIINIFASFKDIYSVLYLTLGFSIILFLISMALSVRIYLKKEF